MSNFIQYVELVPEKSTILFEIKLFNEFPNELARKEDCEVRHNKTSHAIKCKPQKSSLSNLANFRES